MLILLIYRKKKLFEIATELKFNEKALREKCTRDKILIKLLKSHAIFAGSLKRKLFFITMGTKTRFLTSNPNELGKNTRLTK